MYEKLSECLAKGEYGNALFELQEEYLHLDQKTGPEAAQLCVLEATIWEGLVDSSAELDAISKGLSFDPTNYELYYMLGLFYRNINVNWAYLCLEMALHYCKNDDDLAVIESSFNEVKSQPGLRVRNTSIMILSYNDLEMLKKCIASIEDTLPAQSYEIVVVDNNSAEAGVVEFLREKKNSADYRFKLVECDENLGFPKGCNLGYTLCNENNDVFFLNNDAALTKGALFWLRMGLYDNRNAGATGPLSNSASLQEINEGEFKELLPEDIWEKLESSREKWHKLMPFEEAIRIFSEYASKRTTLLKTPYRKAFRLTGFALLLSREALSAVTEEGKVFDEVFSPGYFEDDDLGIRLAMAGFEQYVCLNSFVYHNGGGGFEGHSDAMETGRERFKEKWGFDIWDYSLPWEEACRQVLELSKERIRPLRVIDFTCGFGANAGYLKSIDKNIYVVGVCNSSFAAAIAKRIADDAIYGELNTARLPWPENSFDVVIAEHEFVSRGQIGRCMVPGGLWIGDPGEPQYELMNFNHDARRIADELSEL
ncbi:MAG: glycosyltransferase [Butyrivibrio sp.]|nr:glycosyltransferase [Butyrivibrio sp.]